MGEGRAVKRSAPLTRRTPLRSKRTRNSRQSVIARWSARQTRCAVCHLPNAQGWPPHAAHHLVKRSRRRIDEPWNLLWVYSLCHALLEGEARLAEAYQTEFSPPLRLTFAHALWCKRDANPAEFDRALLERGFGLPFPRLQKPPAFFFRERQKWRDAE
jgi:hypothetical protein